MVGRGQNEFWLENAQFFETALFSLQETFLLILFSTTYVTTIDCIQSYKSVQSFQVDQLSSWRDSEVLSTNFGQ